MESGMEACFCIYSRILHKEREKKRYTYPDMRRWDEWAVDESSLTAGVAYVINCALIHPPPLNTSPTSEITSPINRRVLCCVRQ